MQNVLDILHTKQVGSHAMQLGIPGTDNARMYPVGHVVLLMHEILLGE